MMVLKVCPFCYGEAVVRHNHRGYYVACTKCGVCVGDEDKEDATGCFECFDTEYEAREAWNRSANNDTD